MGAVRVRLTLETPTGVVLADRTKPLSHYISKEVGDVVLCFKDLGP